MQKSFSFRGIVRSTDNLLAREGECMELVNMRVNNGSLQPIHKPALLAHLPHSYSAIYFHSMVAVYMCVTADEGRVHLYNENFEPLYSVANGVSLLADDAVGVRRIEFMGNIACLMTSDSLLYAIYDTGVYKWLGERPKMPSLSFSVDSIVHQVTTDDEYYTGFTRDESLSGVYWRNASKGYFDECIFNLNEKGYYIDRILLRYAFRLFDGSYIYYSPIYYIEDKNTVDGVSRDSGNFVSLRVNNGGNTVGKNKYTVKVQGFKPTLHFSDVALDTWENIIVSIDVFASGSILGHKVVNNGLESSSRVENVYQSSGDGYEEYKTKTKAEIWSDIASRALFYKVAEYNLNGVLVDHEECVSDVKLAQCQTLPSDGGAMVGYSAEYSYVFNGRLHLAPLREKLFKGYAGDVFLPASLDAVSVPAIVCTELKTTNGTSILKREYDNFLLGAVDDTYSMTPYLCYPDARAASMTFVLSLKGKYYRKKFPLSQHKTLNIAYFLNTRDRGLSVSLNAIDTTATSFRIVSSDNILAFFSYREGEYTLTYASDGSWMYNGEKFAVSNTVGAARNHTIVWLGKPQVGDTIIVTLSKNSEDKEPEGVDDIFIDATWEELDSIPDVEERNVVDIRKSVMKVSAVDNPFSFPVAQTYSPSNGAILAMCSNTVALSQGQFGQHPLYLFCDNGIWAMSVDTSGSMAYTASYPLSREVCVNPASVRGIDSGVVFMTSKGLMLLCGGSIKILSSAIDSKTHALQKAPNDSVFRKIAAVVALENLFVDDDFVQYAIDAYIGYNYSEREIIVSNPAYSYSYVCSLGGVEWSKISYAYDFVACSYPHFLAIKNEGSNTVVSTLSDNGVGENSVLLISRPLLWGGKLYKRVLQMMLHAVVIPAVGQNAFNGLACYLLCSNDGVNFKLVTGSEWRQKFSDMVFPYMPTQSYRYFAIAIAGNISTDSKITAVEMFVDVAWSNRLR